MNRRVNGEAISTIRKALGIPQRRLAASARIAPAYLSQIEHDLRQPSPDVTKRIADALGVTLATITYPVVEEVRTA